MIRTPIAKRNHVRKQLFKNVEAIVLSAYNLMMQAQTAGLFIIDGHTPSPIEEEIARKARLHVSELEKAFQYCKEEDIPDLLESYDIMYRIGYSRMPDTRCIIKLQERFLNTWRGGNKNIAESQVYNILSAQLITPDIHISHQGHRELIDMRRRWVEILKKYNRFPGVTSYENYQRLALMMQENLDEYFDGDATEAKRRWYEENRIDDFESLPCRLLRSYRQFALSLFPAVMDFDETQTLDTRILHHLSLVVPHSN